MSKLLDGYCTTCNQYYDLDENLSILFFCPQGHQIEISARGLSENSMPFLILQNQVNSLLDQNRKLLASLKMADDTLEEIASKINEISENNDGNHDITGLVGLVDMCKSTSKGFKECWHLGWEFVNVYSLSKKASFEAHTDGFQESPISAALETDMIGGSLQSTNADSLLKANVDIEKESSLKKMEGEDFRQAESEDETGWRGFFKKKTNGNY